MGLQRSDEMVSGLGDFNRHVEKYIDGFASVHGGSGFGKGICMEKCCLNFMTKNNCALQIHGFKKRKKRKVTFRSGDYKTEIGFALIAQKHLRYLRDVKVIPGELQHRLVVIDMVKKKIIKEIKRK